MSVNYGIITYVKELNLESTLFIAGVYINFGNQTAQLELSVERERKVVRMKKRTIFMFSGQGSQYYHMGKELYENHSRFKFWMDHCDEIVYPFVQTSLIDILYRCHGKSESFDQIIFTNPALLCVEYSLARVLMEMNIQPDFLLGYSLGEITASVFSGIFSLEEGIKLVVGMAELVEGKTKPARMLAIIESQEIMTEFPDLFQKCWLTGKNFQNNFVVSGLKDDIQDLQKNLRQKNIAFQVLPVKYGFHTELMDPIEKEYKQLVRKINLLPIGVPVISSLKCGMLQEVSEDYFWELIRYPIDFEKTIEWVDKNDDWFFIDSGPSGSLATFVKYILPSNSNSLSLQMMNQFGKDLNSIGMLRDGLSNFMFNK